MCKKENRKSQKLSPLYKIAEYLPSVSNSLKLQLPRLTELEKSVIQNISYTNET